MAYTYDDVEQLYNLLGQSVWQLQHLENVMATFTAMRLIQLRRNEKIDVSVENANDIVNKQRKLTLGPLIDMAVKENVVPFDLTKRLENFLGERNWLIHRCVHQEFLSMRNDSARLRLFDRISSFVNEAILIRKGIMDLGHGWLCDMGYDQEEASSLAEKMLAEAESSSTNCSS